MAVTTKKSVLFLAGGVAAAAVVVYAAGAFDPLLKRAPQTIAALPEQGAVNSNDSQPPAVKEPAAPSAPSASAPATPESAKPQSTKPQPSAPSAPAEAVVIPPSFDVVRVEGDGSIVIAGKAAPNASVDLLVGSNVIGSAVAGAEGDFAVVLDDPLQPGDYQIVLRATAPDNVVAMSVETAVVSVPETPEGQVLALVEEPGKPSQMITLPKPQAPAPVAAPAPEAPAAAAPSAATAPTEANPDAQAALPSPTEPPPAPAAGAPVGPAVRVEAVEIDGRKVFVAGVADPGRTVRGYANEILLGDAKAAPDGRYLIEAERDMPVGDYIIRVDALEPNGDKVAARAAVPFEREPGQTLAAVAAPAPASPTDTTTAPAAPATAGKPTASGQAAQTPAAEAPASQQAPSAVAEAPAAPTNQAPGMSTEAPAATATAEVHATVKGAPPAQESGTNVAAAPAGELPAPPSAGVNEVLSPKLKPVDSAVIIRRGDTLWRISRRVYGRGVRYSTIYLANQGQIEDPDRIWPGQVFKVPEKSDDGKADADFSTLGESLTTLPKEDGQVTAPAEAQQ